MSYDDLLAALSRYPVTYVVITLDFCNNTFGSSPCTATGAKCYNTYATCKDRANYSKGSKDYEFTSYNAPLPFMMGERPYIVSVKYLPTEIKTSLTISGRASITFQDEPDTDVGIDPYVSSRSSVQGSFWKKFIARNPNYAGRRIRIYQGFHGLAKNEFEQKMEGVIDNISIKNDGKVVVELADILKTLSTIEIPPKTSIKLAADITDAQTSITLTGDDISMLDASDGYVRIGDEIIFYTTLSAGEITGCTRGYFGTTKSSHNKNDKVQKVRYYEPQSPYDILKTMLLTDAEIDASFVNSTAFTDLKTLDISMVNFSGIISEPTKLNTLYFEIIDLIDCKSWQGEDLKITIKKNLPNYPGRNYQVFTLDENIIAGSDNVDLNKESRKSRISIYWDKTAIGKVDEVASYSKLDIAVDAEGEGANMYNSSEEKTIYCRWLRSDYMDEDFVTQYIANLTKRMLRLLKNPMPIYSFSVELKDSDVKTGNFIRVSTDKILDVDGNPLSRHVFQVIKREAKGNKIELKALEYTKRKLFFIGPNTLHDYTSATEAEKEHGYITDENGKMSDMDDGYFIY